MKYLVKITGWHNQPHFTLRPVSVPALPAFPAILPPNALEAMIITIIVIVVFGMHEIMKGP